MLVSKLYRQICANTGIATDSARVKSAKRAKWMGRVARARSWPRRAEPRWD
jgi:hypothetical protein